MMEKQKVMSQMEGQDKIPQKQLNEVEIGNCSEKEFRIMIVRIIQDLGKRMEAKIEKMQEMFTKDPEELNNASLCGVPSFSPPQRRWGCRWGDTGVGPI